MSETRDPKTKLVGLLTADDRVDDVTRARMWSRLEDRLAAPERAPRSWRMPLAIAGAVAAIAIAWLVVHRDRATTATAADDVIIVRADSTLTTPLGPHARASLTGPAELRVVGVAGDATTVRLPRGTLVAEFTGGTGRSLRIEAPHMTVEIVGTLFAIEASDARTCVSVSHGRVRATTERAVVFVGAGEHACSDDVVASAIAPQIREVLEHQAAAVAIARAEPTPVPVPAPVPQSVPEPSSAPAPAPVPLPPRPPRPPVAIPQIAEAPAPPEPAPAPVVVEPTKPPAPVAPVAPPVDPAEALYRTAEAALAHRDYAAADRALAQLVATSPRSPLVDEALLERARIAYARHAWDEARHRLAELAAIARSPLAESGGYLTCRIAVDTHDGDAAPCLVAFRARFPRSAHDQDALATLAQLAGDCATAQPYTAELARRYPRSAAARAWQSHCGARP